MKLVGIALVVLVALEHLYFLYLEMFLWTKPKGLKIFGNSAQKAEDSKVLAANQGLYNGFLAVGLLWGAIRTSRDFMIFFLLCVIVAGVYGGLTAKMSILYIQAAPGLLALLAVLAARPKAQA